MNRWRDLVERNYEESALFEHQFWLKVLTDHTQFLLDALAPKEKEDIKKLFILLKHLRIC